MSFQSESNDRFSKRTKDRLNLFDAGNEGPFSNEFGSLLEEFSLRDNNSSKMLLNDNIESLDITNDLSLSKV